MDNVEEGEITPSNDAFQFRMGLNDNKAGMEGLDKEKINKIIMDATKGSKFYENELKKDKQLNQRIEKMMQQKSQLTSQQIKKAQLQVDRLALELERNRDLSRVIVHVDMDAFYAAVEMRDNPELKDTPMAVGSMSMLSTSNYHARRYGVRAAMPGFIAKKLCPSLVIVPVNFDKYRAVSKQVREILAQYDPNFLPMSLDEAYLDITDHLKERISWPEDKRSFNFETKMKDEKNPSQDPAVDGGTKELCTSPILFEDSPSLEVEQNAHVSAATSAKQPLKKFVVFGTSAEEAVNEMRFRIEQETTLTASAGIAPNMMLAKVCSDKNKPNGQYRIVSERQAVKDFIKDLPIRKVPGIGKVTEKMLKALGVMTCTDLYQQRALLSLLFSETSWQNFLHISLGIGSTHIERDGERKSMSTERTFSEISCTKEQYDLCRELCKDLAQDLLKEGLKGKTVTLKLKNVKFEVRTRALTVTSAVSTEEEIFSVAKEILKTEIDLASPESLRLRLMGVRVSGFLNEETKKHQKSIVGFLQNEKSGNAVPLGPPDRTSPSTQTPGPQRQSFFNQKRAAREQMGRETFTDSSGFSKGAEIDSAEPRTEMPQTEVLPQKPDYFCPICSQNKSDWDLESFNKHIDRCLTGSPLANDFDVRPKAEVNINNDDWEKEINSNEIRNAAFSIQNLSNQTLDTEPINDIVYKNTIESNIVTNIRNFHTFGVDPDSVCTEKEVDVCNTEKEPAKPNSEMASSDQIFICPVCNVKQDVPDLAAFNRHVDICLNKGIIEKLREERVNINHPTHNLQHTGGTGRGLTSTNAKLRTKRSAATNQNPVSKKSKPNPSKNTIDRFFK